MQVTIFFHSGKRDWSSMMFHLHTAKSFATKTETMVRKRSQRFLSLQQILQNLNHDQQLQSSLIVSI